MTTDTFAAVLIVLVIVMVVAGVMLIRLGIRRRDLENDALNRQLMFDEELDK